MSRAILSPGARRALPSRMPSPSGVAFFLPSVRSRSEAGHLAASLMPRVLQESEAADVDHGKVFYLSLERRRGLDGPARARSSRSVGPKAAAIGGGSSGSPRCVRIFRIGPGSVMNAISRMSPPQFGHSSGNSSPTRAMSFAKVIREVSCERGFWVA